MNIKSNRKKQGPSFLQSAWLGFLEVVPEMGTGMKILTVLGGFVAAYFLWDYSGMASVFAIIFSFILIVQDQWNEIGFGARLTFTVIAMVFVYFLGSINVYFPDKKIINVEYSKLTFTDSTEKLIIFMTSPVVKTINQPLSTTQYYTLKEQKDKITMSIEERGEYDHWNMLDGRDTNNTEIETYGYGFTIKAGDLVIENKYWIKDSDRKFISKIKTEKDNS